MTSVFLVLALALAAACGGSDDGGSAQPAEASTPDQSAPVELPAGCSFAPFDFEVRFSGDGPRESLTIVDAVAIRGFEGGAWTLILATEPFPEDANFEFGLLGLPEDVLVLQAGIFVSSSRAQEPQDLIRAGEVFETGDAEPRLPVFGVLQGRANLANSVDRHEKAEVLYAAEDAACIAFEVTSESGPEFVGVAAGKVVVNQ